MVTFVLMIKKRICRFYSRTFKNDIKIIEIVLHTKYTDTELVYLSYIKMGDSKKDVVNIRQVINIGNHLWRKNKLLLYFDLRPGPKILFHGNTPEGSDTFQRPVIERDRVGRLRLMIWDKVKVSLCHYSHAPEESNL